MALQSIIDDDELVAILYSMSYRLNDRSTREALTAASTLSRSVSVLAVLLLLLAAALRLQPTALWSAVSVCRSVCLRLITAERIM